MDKGFLQNKVSRWLLLENKREEIDRLSLDGKLDVDEYVMHLGGGIQLTISAKFPTVDIRQFWKPDDSEKPGPTRKGIALNRFKWERLCEVMELIRDFVPELDQAYICLESHPNEIELSACKECYPFDKPEESRHYDISPNQEGDFEIMKSAWM